MAREERPQLPPPGVPVRQFTTPVVGEGFYTERIDTSKPDYRPIERGTKYSSIVGGDKTVNGLFPALYFLKETPPLPYPWATRIWATDRLAEDTYNSAVEYVSEAVNYPAFTRVYVVRRDEYESTPPIVPLSPLTSLIAVKMIDNGADYTFATARIEGVGTGAKIEFIIDVNGQIASAIVTNVGTGYTEPPTIFIDGDGGDARAIAIIQPQSALLVSQKKTELSDDHPLRNEYVLLTRVYESLPGPFVYSQKVDTDGAIITVKKRRNIASDIITEEILVGALWSQTTKNATENDFVAEEIVESRDIAISFPLPPERLTTTRVDDDGNTVTVQRTMSSKIFVDSIVTRESVTAGAWIRITSEAITDKKVWLVVESRPVPGNEIRSAKVESDNLIKFQQSILNEASLTVPSVSEAGGIITTVDKEPVSDLISKQVTSEKQIFDAKSFSIRIPILIPERFRGAVPIRGETHVHAGTAVAPTLAAGEFERTNSQEAELVEKQEVTSIDSTTLPVTLISYGLNKYKQITTISETLDTGLQTLTGDISDLTEDAAVDALQADTLGNVLLSLKKLVTVSVLFTHETSGISIPNPIPEEFRNLAPTYDFQETFAGSITVPQILGIGELSRSEQQVDEFTFIRSVTSLPVTDLPITRFNHEITSRYGGGILKVTLTLDNTETGVDGGLLIVSAEEKNIGNGLFVRIIRELDTAIATAWPTLTDLPFDEEMQTHIQIDRQVVDPSYSFLTGAHFVENKKAIDKWKSERTRTTKIPSAVDEASALVSSIFAPFQFPGTLDVFSAAFSASWLGYRAVKAAFVEQILKTWWVDSSTKPVIPYDNIITDSITITTNTRIERFHGVLHDAYVAQVGTFTQFYAPTTPSFTEYYFGTPDGTSTDHNLIVLYSPGSGYSVGDTIGIPSDSGPSAQVQVTALGLSGSILQYNVTLEGVGGIFTNPVSGTGGGGSGVQFNVLPYSVPNYIPGSQWINTPKVVAADVTPTDIPNQWKIKTRTTVMR